MNGTARATAYGYSLWEFVVHTGRQRHHHAPTDRRPPPPDSFWGDTSTIPAAQNVLEVKILNRTNGQYPDSQVYWSFNGQTHSIAEQPYFDMPANSAGRMYFYLGSPTSQYYDFIEFTVGADVFNGNTTRVDGFGAASWRMRLHAHDGLRRRRSARTRRRSPRTGRPPSSSSSNAVPAEFKVLAPDPGAVPDPGAGQRPGVPGRRRSTPNYFTALRASRSASTQPTSEHLRLRRLAGQQPGSARRSTGTSPSCRRRSGQTRRSYYQAAPANYYAKFWHDHAINHLAYGFPYDDVAGQSSFISHGNPQWLVVAVGF